LAEQKFGFASEIFTSASGPGGRLAGSYSAYGSFRQGVGTALVGSAETVAERLREYQALGVQTIIASGYPHLEEAYRVAELLFPVLGIGRQASEPGREFRAGPSRIAAE